MQNTQITPDQILADLGQINTLVFRLLTDYNRAQLADVRYSIEDELRRVLAEVPRMEDYSLAAFRAPLPLDRFRDIQNGLDFIARLPAQQPAVYGGGGYGGRTQNRQEARSVYGQAARTGGYGNSSYDTSGNAPKSNSKYAADNYVDKSPAPSKKNYAKQAATVVVPAENLVPEKGHEYPFLVSTGIVAEKTNNGASYHYELYGVDELSSKIDKTAYTFQTVEFDSNDKFKTVLWNMATSNGKSILGQDRRLKSMVLKVGPTFDPKQVAGLAKSFKEKPVLTIEELKMFLNATRNTAISKFIDILLTKRFTELCTLGDARNSLEITGFAEDIEYLITTYIPELEQVIVRNRVSKAVERTLAYAKLLIENISVDIKDEYGLVSIYDISTIIVLKDPELINLILSTVRGAMTVSEDSCASLHTLLTTVDVTEDVFSKMGMVRLLAFDALQTYREYTVYQKDKNYTIKG